METLACVQVETRASRSDPLVCAADEPLHREAKSVMSGSVQVGHGDDVRGQRQGRGEADQPKLLAECGFKTNPMQGTRFPSFCQLLLIRHFPLPCLHPPDQNYLHSVGLRHHVQGASMRR